MEKIIDFRKTVYELAAEYPEFKEIMASVGFKEITEPEILASAGKVMTVPKGSRMKGIPMEKIVKAFEAKGFQVSRRRAGAADQADASHAADCPCQAAGPADCAVQFSECKAGESGGIEELSHASQSG